MLYKKYATIFINTYKFDDSESGLNSYYISTTNSKPTASSSSWVGINNISGCSLGSKTCNFTYNNIPKNTTYYIWVKDQVGNISNVVTSNVNKLKKKLSYEGKWNLYRIEAGVKWRLKAVLRKIKNNFKKIK